MTGNEKKRIVRMDPAVAEEFRIVTSRLDEITDESRRLAIEFQDERRAREALERQEVHIDDMSGKQLPFKYQINIPLPGRTERPVIGTVNVSRDGPFICRRLYVSAVITDAQVVEGGGNTYDYTSFIGRYIPITSSRSVETLYPNFTTFPVPRLVPLIFPDFQWEYSDYGSERNRQDKPISGDILNRQDDDGFLMNNDIFAAGTTINFTLTPTHPSGEFTSQVGLFEIILISGVFDIEMQVTFDGFKVLQPLEM